MQREPIQDHELEALAREVLGEYDAVRIATTAAIALYGRSGSGALMRDQFVTSLNVHGRNLVEFFNAPTGRKQYADDVHATDFAPTWDPGADGGIDLAFLRVRFVPGVNRRLSHISARRVRAEAKEDAVPVTEIYLAIAGMMERFIARLPPERTAWFAPDGELPDTSIAPVLEGARL